MFGFLFRLLGFGGNGRSSGTITFANYMCHTPLRLDRPMTTPMGGRVKILLVRVDIDYLIDGPDIRIRDARLCQDGESNMYSDRTGESWRATGLSDPACLAQAVANDLEDHEGYLWRAMHARWRDEGPKPK